MSQHDGNIANASGASVRADINSALDAIFSNHSGATAPSPTFPHQWWVDEATNLVKQRNAGNTAWDTIGAKDANGFRPYYNGAVMRAFNFRAERISNASIPSGAATTLLYSTELTDDAAAYVPATGLYTAPASGFYLFTWSGFFPSGSTYTGYTFLSIDGTTGGRGLAMTSGSERSSPGSAMVQMTAGQTASIRAFHNTGSSMTPSSPTDGGLWFFSGARVGA